MEAGQQPACAERLEILGTAKLTLGLLNDAEIDLGATCELLST